ncbi:hypothetical protein NHX12_030492 [Muraenolepis orangiensis]|uniref:F-box domain-containing protein n=1 Tax=Muraenolepis orangiensis TaxID=630683 RepID=A0A9Q0E9Y3_9TELE|nr:hypothetical protein NHX12_030492 [Muraenolepis orangiensis]
MNDDNHQVRRPRPTSSHHHQRRSRGVSVGSGDILQWLPAELWLHVLRYLPAADRLSVRATCRYFDRLVVHHHGSSLWRDYTACFRFKPGRYNNPQFWASMSRRGIRSAVVRGGGTREKHWGQLAAALPSLSTLIVDQGLGECAGHLDKFPALKDLVLRGSSSSSSIKRTPPDLMTVLRVADPQQMTLLSLCDVGSPSSHNSFLAFLSQFPNLTSLLYHSAADKRSDDDDHHHLQTFRCVVSALPKLKHLSWSTHRCFKYYGVPGKCVGEAETDGLTMNQTLTSLELVVYDDSCLSYDNAMRSLSRLQSLTVVYTVDTDKGCRLNTWLGHLRHLSTLVVDGGPPPREYAWSIPTTVCSLTLRVHQLTSADLVAVASRVPGLLHLQLDTWPAEGCHTGLILKLFPALQSIKLSVWQIGEKNFLDFHRSPSMRTIEVMDAADSPRIPELCRQLQVLTDDKVRVVMSTGGRDPRACCHQARVK